MISEDRILSGACALAMGASETDVGEPGDGEPAEIAFLRAMASRVYLALESGAPRKRHPFASNGRRRFKVALPPFRTP